LPSGPGSCAPNFTIYEASYVALAELAEAALVTLDRRLARAPGVAGRVLVLAFE
jgi:predicted nucleic acid-binding protein